MTNTRPRVDGRIFACITGLVLLGREFSGLIGGEVLLLIGSELSRSICVL